MLYEGVLLSLSWSVRFHIAKTTRLGWQRKLCAQLHLYPALTRLYFSLQTAASGSSDSVIPSTS